MVLLTCGVWTLDLFVPFAKFCRSMTVFLHSRGYSRSPPVDAKPFTKTWEHAVPGLLFKDVTESMAGQSAEIAAPGLCSSPFVAAFDMGDHHLLLASLTILGIFRKAILGILKP
ncbi:hypothetical protein SKAU_G00218030 [Synaphobranchus kaupii]|uniref:Uncharacterized protein n=1 Tax=Synaphobranchus kaupii TaxID=118154 RepID=A0A9Q1FA73_SYNKA|nr:hypothetical protein SKAU_G00218030 [Synaphobranchus kaupii]